MKIKLNKNDLISADCVLHEAIFYIANEYWNSFGKKQFKEYKDCFKRYKRRKTVDELDFEHVRTRIEQYTEIEKALTFLNTVDFNELDAEIYHSIDTVMKHRGMLWI